MTCFDTNTSVKIIKKLFQTTHSCSLEYPETQHILKFNTFVTESEIRSKTLPKRTTREKRVEPKIEIVGKKPETLTERFRPMKRDAQKPSTVVESKKNAEYRNYRYTVLMKCFIHIMVKKKL